MTDQMASTNWVLLCTILVLLMQVGFLWLESGLVRQKSKINVAVKNVADFCVSAAVFWALGFGVMFGVSSAGFFGATDFLFEGSSVNAWDQVFFFFQLAFCGTAVTIVSGAIAERASFRGYIIIALICSALVYPVFGHWAWGGLLTGVPTGWLEKIGFIDFAGSTVVHGIGGWVALAAAIVVGPRLGRFGRNKTIVAHDMSMSIAGAFVLWIGWFGFNGGSVLALDSSVPGVLLNTLMAPAAGGLAGLSISWILQGRPNVGDLINGVLAGLVAVTANCHIVVIQEAFVIGAVGGAVCYAGCRLLERLKIDDAVSAVPVHLVAGIWGTLAVALYGDVAAFGEGVSRVDQFAIQLIGVASAGAYSLAVALPLLWIARQFGLLRVAARDELEGLNISEHAIASPMQVLLKEMEQQARHGDFTKPVKVDQDGDVSLFARGYNRVLKRVASEQAEKDRVLNDLQEAMARAETANIAKSQFLANVSHELRTPLNAILGFSQLINQNADEKGLSAEDKEYLQIVQDSGSHLLGLIVQVLKYTDIESDKLDLNESDFSLAAAVNDVIYKFSDRIKNAGVDLKCDFELVPNLYGDPEAVGQIFVNLISNALKHSQVGQTVAVQIFATSDGRINLVVADDGSGIAAEKLAAIFEPFNQGVPDNSLDKPDGLGLGLAIAKRLADMHGAELFLQSRQGQGTQVTLRFPPERTTRKTEAYQVA